MNSNEILIGCFSPHFRRLNGKTQVFPFPQIDGIHNRLTHSLECASVGWSLGTLIGNELEKSGKIDGNAMGFHFLTYTNPRISAVDGG